MSPESTLFLRQLLSNPRQVSAISPSSPWLARAMTAGLHPHSGPVVEFGPGTGRLTKAILARGIAPHDLTLFEMNADFVRHLRAGFPGVMVHHGAAQSSAELMAGKPVAKLVPLTPAAAPAKRRLGSLAGLVTLSPDFDAPLPDDLLDAFEGR